MLIPICAVISSLTTFSSIKMDISNSPTLACLLASTNNMIHPTTNVCLIRPMGLLHQRRQMPVAIVSWWTPFILLWQAKIPLPPGKPTGESSLVLSYWLHFHPWSLTPSINRPTPLLVPRIILPLKSSFCKVTETNVIGGHWVPSCLNASWAIHLCAQKAHTTHTRKSWTGIYTYNSRTMYIWVGNRRI